MRRFLLLVLMCAPLFAQQDRPTRLFPTDPINPCSVITPNVNNWVAGRMWQCVGASGVNNGIWRLISQAIGPCGTDCAQAFGAVGNGIADDSAALQACVNAIPAQGGKCFLPTGTYLVGTGINVPGLGAFLVGNPASNLTGTANQGASIIKEKNGANLAYVVQLAGNFSGLRDLVIDGNKANNSTGQDAVRVTLAARVQLERVTAQNAKRDGFHIASATGSGEESCCGRMINSFAIANTGDGGYIFNANDWMIALTEFENNLGNAGLEMDGANGTRFTGNDFGGNSGHGLWWHCANSLTEVCSGQVQLVNNQFGNNQQHDLFVDGKDPVNGTSVSDGWIVEGDNFLGRAAGALNTYDAIHLIDTGNSNVSGNHIYGSTRYRYGIFIGETSPPGTSGLSAAVSNTFTAVGLFGTSSISLSPTTDVVYSFPGGPDFRTTGVTYKQGTFINLAAGPGTVSSANTITPPGMFFHMNGTAVVKTINLGVAEVAGQICALADTAWSWDATGNISIASTGAVTPGQTYCFIYDAGSPAKWYPQSLH